MQAAQSLLDERLRAISDPIRRDILSIARNEQTAGDIAHAFDISRPAVSRHLAVLRRARLVRVRMSGTARYYQSDTAALHEISCWFASFWDEGLPKLKSLAEAEQIKNED